MKKILLFLGLFLLLIPFCVKAEDLNDKVIIKSIELLKKSNNTEEIGEATINDLNVSFNLKFFEVGDYAKYKLIVVNNTDDELELTADNIKSEDGYTMYDIEYEESNVIKKDQDNIIYITAKYNQAPPKEAFRSSKVEDIQTLSLKLFKDTIDIPDTIKNMSKTFVILLVFFILGIVLYKRNEKMSKTIILLLFVPLLTPIVGNAAVEFEISIDSNIVLAKIKPNPCTYEGELVQGAEYVDGQYTYRYMQESDYTNGWRNITYEGWGVQLTDKDSTNPVTTKLCSVINDKPIVSMTYMFNNSKAEEIDITSFDTSQVKSMQYMFNYVSNVEELDFSSFNTSNVENMVYMFNNATGLKGLDLRYFDTSNLVYYAQMFSYASSLESLNLDNWDLRKAGVSGGHLSGARSLKSISAKNWILPETFTNWVSRAWGGNNSPIETIDVTGWDLSNTKDLQGLFAGSYYLKNIIGLETWDTPNVVNMEYMFSMCSRLTSIDLSNFNTSKVTNVKYMLGGCYDLKNVNLSNFDFSRIDVDYNGFLYDILDYRDVSIDTLDLSNAIFPSNMSNAFSNYKNIKSIILDDVDTSHVTKMDWMFKDCTSITELDLSSFDTSNVTTIAGMFEGCTGLTELDLSSFDVSHIPSYSGFSAIFKNVTNLKTLNISNWDLRNVNYSNLSNILYLGNTGVETLNMSKVIFPSDSSFAFTNLPYLKHLTLDDVDTSNVTNMSHMFNTLASLEEIDVSSFNTSNVVNMDHMFTSIPLLKEIDVSNFDTSKVTNFYAMFSSLRSLEYLDLSTFKVDQLTSHPWGLIDGSENVLEINLSNWDFSNYSNYNMFGRMLGGSGYSLAGESGASHKLKKIVLKNAKFGQDMSYCFGYMPNIEEIVLTGADISKTTTMRSVFSGARSLKSLDLSSFDFPENTGSNYEYAFSDLNISTIYVKDQATADMLNALPYPHKPSTLTFVVK